MEELNVAELEDVAGGKGKKVVGHIIITHINRRVHVRKAPNKDGAHLNWAYLNDVFGYYGKTGGWFIVYTAGSFGYIHESHCAIID